MNSTNHRVFTRSVLPVPTFDAAVVAAKKYWDIHRAYLELMKKDRGLVNSDRVDRMSERWARAQMKVLKTIPTTWGGVLAIIEICTDKASIDSDDEELAPAMRSLSKGIRRLLRSNEFKTA